MANELNIALPTSGLTVTAQPYQAGAAVGSAISLSEVGTSGFYSGNMTGSAGTYQLAFRAAGANVGSGSIVWSGSAEVPASTFNPSSDTVANVTLCATTTTLTNAPTVPSASAIASQVRTELSVELGRVDQNISSRLAAADYTAPSAAPTVTAIRQELDSNSTKLANLDATVSSRLASSAYSAAPTTAQIATAVEGSLLNEADGQAVLNALVSAIGNTNLSEVSLVAAVRADLERNGGKLDSIPTTAAPSASAVAGAVRTELGVELGRLDASVSSRLAPSGTLATVTNLTNAPASVTPSDIWSHATRTLTSASGPTAVEIRQEIDANSTKLDAAISSRMAASEVTKIDAVKAKTDNLPASPAATGDIPSANITAIKTRLDSINVERVNNTATTNIVGTLLAQSQS